MYGIIYRALNVTNNKFYVGQTVKSLTERKAIHYYYARRGIKNYYFYNALRKYKDWEWNILQVTYCKEELDTQEKYWIRVLNSMMPNGYNTREGGANGRMSEESCNKIRKKLTGYKHTKEHCEAKKGNTNGCGNRGKKRTEEHRKHYSEAKKGVKLSKEACKNISEAHKKAVLCVETKKVYRSIMEAKKETGISSTSNISQVANGKRKTAGGYSWKYITKDKQGIK